MISKSDTTETGVRTTWKVRRRASDDARGKRKKRSVTGRCSHVLASISPVCSSKHVGQQCLLRENDRATHFTPSIIFLVHAFHATAAAVPGVFPAAALSTASKGAPCGRAVERRWRALVEIRNVASSVESRNTGPSFTCALSAAKSKLRSLQRKFGPICVRSALGGSRWSLEKIFVSSSSRNKISWECTRSAMREHSSNEISFLSFNHHYRYFSSKRWMLR